MRKVPLQQVLTGTCCCHRREQVRRQSYKAFIDQPKLFRSVRESCSLQPAKWQMQRPSQGSPVVDEGQHKRLKMHVEADGKLLLKGYGPDSFLEALTSRGIVFLAGSSESQVPPAPGRRAGRRRYAGRGQRKISPEGTLSFTGFLLLGDAV